MKTINNYLEIVKNDQKKVYEKNEVETLILEIKDNIMEILRKLDLDKVVSFEEGNEWVNFFEIEKKIIGE